jgi:hypothetical protein
VNVNNSTTWVFSQNTFLQFTTGATGTMIGSAANQKFAFWGATPAVQPLTTDDHDTVLINTGLKPSGGKTPYSNTFITAMDETINTNRQVVIDEFYEIGSGFVTELAGANSLLYIHTIQTPSGPQTPNLQQDYNIFITQADETVPAWAETTFMTEYEIAQDRVTEVSGNGVLVVGVESPLPWVVSGSDASGAFVELVKAA